MTTWPGAGVQPDLDRLQHEDYAPRVSKEASVDEASVDNDALLHRHGLQVTARRLAVTAADSPAQEIDDADFICWR
jgi:hypothetical protein